MVAMPLTATLLPAFIPSPSTSEFVLGPLHLRAYGLFIAIGVIAGLELARRRWAARGGDPDDITAVALWAVPAGLIGARLYHVVTDYQRYEGHWFDALQVWHGGLGIPGGIAAGVAVGLVVARRRGIDAGAALDACIPALPLAQAIGRLGNYFNQELYGRPTRLPWGLEIDLAHRPDGYAQFATFHPTFLYEAIWNLALMAILVWIDRRKILRPGRLVWVYVAGYALGRLWVEALRIDPASLILGIRVNIWTSVLAFAIGTTVALLSRQQPSPDPVS